MRKISVLFLTSLPTRDEVSFLAHLHLLEDAEDTKLLAKNSCLRCQASTVQIIRPGAHTAWKEGNSFLWCLRGVNGLNQIETPLDLSRLNGVVFCVCSRHDSCQSGPRHPEVNKYIHTFPLLCIRFLSRITGVYISDFMYILIRKTFCDDREMCQFEANVCSEESSFILFLNVHCLCHVESAC